MVTLNDYLYSGSTILSILKDYERDLRKDAIRTKNQIDIVHCNFLLQYTELLEHNDFITTQSQKMREFYNYLAGKYPFLAFSFKGRIKSLFRAEEKFNGKVVNYMYDYYKKHGVYPPALRLRSQLHHFHDLIAYRIIISLP
ncbi:MAG: hypothetical protein KBS81_00085 [Spirochaetales bacterium]|nr:hypothetical protein [Candidatus Physcosoma equi]